MKKPNRLNALGFTMLAFLATGFEKRASQRVEDKREDAGREAGQTLEQTGEKMKDATN